MTTLFDDKSPYSIGDATIDPSAGEVSLHGVTQRVEPRLMSVLNRLATYRGQVVSRAELLDAVWQGHKSGDESLTQAISGLRSVLGDSPRKPTYIQTIPKTGYRLLAEPVRGGRRMDTLKTASLLRIGQISRPLFAVAIAVLLLVFGAFMTYFYPDPNPNPDYDIDIESMDIESALSALR